MKCALTVGVLAALLPGAVGCDQILGIDIIDDAGEFADGAMDGTSWSQDGEVDSTVWDAAADIGTSNDAMIHDATSDSTMLDSGVSETADARESGVDCPALLAQMRSARIRPPFGWFGLDLSGGAEAGLSIDSVGVLACATSVESENIEAGVSPLLPGARGVELRSAELLAEGSLAMFYNLESRVVWVAESTYGPLSTLEFHARIGGAYDDGGPDGGPSIYAIGQGSGYGTITRNGSTFPANWSAPVDDAGASIAKAWANEVYDGLVATYDPSIPAVADCFDEPFVRSGFEPQRVSVCSLQGNGTVTFSAQTLGLRIEFAPGPMTLVARIYEDFPGGTPSCSTPQAARERMDYSPIAIFGNDSSLVGPVWAGVQMAYLTPAEPLGNDAGMLATEADKLAGCNGVSVAGTDPGYAAEQWGTGEVKLEYSPDSGIAYRLFVTEGYYGQLLFSALEDDGGQNVSYALGIGVLTADGVPIDLNWSNGGEASLNTTVTKLSNGWFSSAGCSFVDSDCVQQGDCAIVPDDLDGHSTFTFAMSPAHAASCADPHPITFVFDQGASVPSEIYVTNPGGAR